MQTRPFLILALCAAAGATFTPAQAQTLSITNTASNSISSAAGYSTILLGKFDTGLGTLQSVAVKVNYSSISGSYNVTTATSQAFNLAASVDLNIRQVATNSLGFTALGPTSFTLATTPPTTGSFPGITIPASTSTNISVNQTNVFVNQSQLIDSVNWAAYQSASPGTVAFEFDSVPTISVAGGGFVVNTDNLTVETSMSVVYTYDVIPEPSTYALLGVAALGFAGYRLRRRRA